MAFISKKEADIAVKFLKKNKNILIYCECCHFDTPIKMKIKKVYAEHTGYEDFYQVVVEGKNEATKKQEPHKLDLAYVFYKKKKMAYNVGLELGFECDPCIPHPFGWDER